MENIVILDNIPENEYYSFNGLMLDLINKNKNPLISVYSGYWLNIGRVDDYEEAINIFWKQEKIFVDEKE